MTSSNSATEQELFVNEVPLQDCSCSTAPFTAQWEQIPSSSTTFSPRGGHTAIYLSPTSTKFPHSILLFGGANREGAAFNDCHLFDITTKSWKDLNDSIHGTRPSPRSGHAAVLIDNSMIIHGGQRIHFPSQSSNNQIPPSEPTIELLSDTWKFDFSSLTWQIITTAKSLTRNCGIAGIINNKICIMGGSDERGPTNSLYQLSQLSNSNNWELISVIGSDRDPRELHSGCFDLTNNIWLTSGGRSELGILNSIYSFHINEKRWELLGQAPPRCGHTMEIINKDFSFIFGGIDGLTFYNDITVFSQGKGSISACDECHGPRGWHRLNGGPKTENENNDSNNNNNNAATSNNSQSSSVLPAHRFAHTLTSLTGSSLSQYVLIGGMNDEADLHDVWTLTIKKRE